MWWIKCDGHLRTGYGPAKPGWGKQWKFKLKTVFSLCFWFKTLDNISVLLTFSGRANWKQCFHYVFSPKKNVFVFHNLGRQTRAITRLKATVWRALAGRWWWTWGVQPAMSFRRVSPSQAMSLFLVSTPPSAFAHPQGSPQSRASPSRWTLPSAASTLPWSKRTPRGAQKGTSEHWALRLFTISTTGIACGPHTGLQGCKLLRPGA